MTLLQHHLAHLHGSGLTDETIAAAGIYSVTDPTEAGTLVNWKGPAPAPAIAFPYLALGGQAVGTVLRPDVPHAREDGRAPKYETPVGMSPRLYFPPAALVPPAAYADPQQPLILVEGIKKVLCAAQAGGVGISIQGTTVAHDTEWRKSQHGAPNEWRLNPDFTGIPLIGRGVYVAFDGGDTTSNPPVILAEARIARLLVDAGAHVRLLRIPSPDGSKVGLDDHLVKQSDCSEALQLLLTASIVADPLLRARELKSAKDKPTAALSLLRDWSFGAAIDVGGTAVFDVVAAELRQAAWISKKAIAGAREEFNELRRRHSAPKATAAAPEDAAAPPEPDPEIQAAAEALLRDPDLVEQFYTSVAADGLVGEQKTALLILLALVSRKTPRPNHIVIKAASSAGKNFTLGKVTNYLPPGDLIEISDMSPRALQYMTAPITGKVIVITEQEGADRAEYPMRVAMSEGKLTVLVAEKVEGEEGSRVETREHTVEGPACFITTTTRAMLHDENETRVMELTLDESPEQTRLILHSHALAAERPRTSAERAAAQQRRALWQAVLGGLESRDVVVPNAGSLAATFPVGRVRARRDFPKFIAIIQALALLHQHQRSIVDDRLVASDLDVSMARDLCAALWSDLSPRIAAVAGKLKDGFGDTEFTATTAAKLLGQHSDAVRRLLKELERHELVEQVDQGKGSRAGRWRNKPDAPEPVAANPPAAVVGGAS